MERDLPKGSASPPRKADDDSCRSLLDQIAQGSESALAEFYRLFEARVYDGERGREFFAAWPPPQQQLSAEVRVSRSDSTVQLFYEFYARTRVGGENGCASWYSILRMMPSL